MKLIRVIQSKIVKKDNKYQVQSEKGKNLGTYDTKAEAEERLKQVEMFKHMNAKNITPQDAEDLFIEEMRKKGFPSEEELKKQYEDYVKEVEIKNYNQNANLHKDPVDYEDFKYTELERFSNNLLNYKPDYYPKKWDIVDEWIETDDDPIEEPKDVEVE